MEKLIILNYADSSVHIYDVEGHRIIDEDFIDSLGFAIDECEWMSNSEIEIIFHKEAL